MEYHSLTQTSDTNGIPDDSSDTALVKTAEALLLIQGFNSIPNKDSPIYKVWLYYDPEVCSVIPWLEISLHL